MITCNKCKGKIFVDRVFTTPEYLELYCLLCGKREMIQHPESKGKREKWIMQMERMTAKRSGSKI